MNIVKGLLKKDLYNLSNYKTTLIIITLFCIIPIVTDSINLGPIILCTIVGMISLSTFNYDEISKSNKYILTLPNNRKEIVKEKYILAIGASLLGGILGFIITIVIANIVNYIRPDNLINIDFNELMISTIGGMFGIALVQSLQIPSIYKWGAEKGRIQMFVLVFGLVALISGTVFLLMKLNFNINLEMIENFMNTFGVALIILVITIMYFISYKISYQGLIYGPFV